MTYSSTKTYGHEVGLSAAFRQWRADSHCNKLHGYAIAVKFTFEAIELDVRQWVVDFGSLKSLKGWLENSLDHKTLVAKDDPNYEWFVEGHRLGVLDMIVVDATGCEALAKMIFDAAEVWLHDNGYSPRVWLTEVEVCEHGANSAIYRKG